MSETAPQYQRPSGVPHGLAQQAQERRRRQAARALAKKWTKAISQGRVALDSPEIANVVAFVLWWARAGHIERACPSREVAECFGTES